MPPRLENYFMRPLSPLTQFIISYFLDDCCEALQIEKFTFRKNQTDKQMSHAICVIIMKPFQIPIANCLSRHFI